MATVEIDGIRTRYEVMGSGPPLLMYSPGGFNARIESWSALGVYKRIKLLDHLPDHYSCIVFDRRETGLSGGRVERVTWDHYVAQGRGLLQHLGYEQAHLMGGCMGCSPLLRFAVTHPEMIKSLVLYFPVGGPRYRLNSHQRFATHMAYVAEHGLDAVVELCHSHDQHFGQDPRCGPWAAPIRTDPAFAESFRSLDPSRYLTLVAGMARTLFDRDTAPGAEPEDLLQCDLPALIIPGADASHGTSAARYCNEVLGQSEYWDIAPDDQQESNSPARILEFLNRHN
jgi:pimeloyl-ACP methyl ester carboxylesterase